MNELFRAFMTVLPLLMVALLVVLWRPARRLRERDRLNPPSTRALAMRALPFVAILVAGGIWGLVSERWELVVWAVIGIPCFGYALLRYERHQKSQH